MSILAIANRKGGVGKSTIATMIAYGLAVWAKQRVLIIDLDAQCNASLILFGGQNWSVARNKSQTVSDYFSHRFNQTEIDFSNYLFHEVGDVMNGSQKHPQISLIPGSVEIEDIEHELLHRLADLTNGLHEAEAGVIGRMGTLLRLGLRRRSDFTHDREEAEPPRGQRNSARGRAWSAARRWKNG